MCHAIETESALSVSVASLGAKLTNHARVLFTVVSTKLSMLSKEHCCFTSLSFTTNEKKIKISIFLHVFIARPIGFDFDLEGKFPSFVYQTINCSFSCMSLTRFQCLIIKGLIVALICKDTQLCPQGISVFKMAEILRRQWQRERHQTKGLMSRTIDLHVRLK